MSISKFNIFLILESLVKNIFLIFISIYRYVLKPLLGSRACCRFEPSCSEYAAQSFKQFSVIKALRLTVLRLSKCHPYGQYGYDPIPVEPTERKI